MERKELIDNVNKIHTTEMGVERIKKNLKLNTKCDVVEYCKNKILIVIAIFINRVKTGIVKLIT